MINDSSSGDQDDEATESAYDQATDGGEGRISPSGFSVIRQVSEFAATLLLMGKHVTFTLPSEIERQVRQLPHTALAEFN